MLSSGEPTTSLRPVDLLARDGGNCGDGDAGSPVSARSACTSPVGLAFRWRPFQRRPLGALQSNDSQERLQEMLTDPLSGAVTGAASAVTSSSELDDILIAESPDCTWNRVNPIWEASESVSMSSGIMKALVTPSWRVLLLSDGSVTRHLQLMTDISVKVDCFDQREIKGLQGVPESVSLIPGPHIQRQVYLLNSVTQQPLVYAVSWWSAPEMKEYMQEMSQPIWVNLAARKAELFREVQRVYLGNSPELEAQFDSEGPFWARHYIFWHEGRPLTVIYEVFSNALEEYLGASRPDTQSW
eukprot:gene5123-6232_t